MAKKNKVVDEVRKLAGKVAEAEALNAAVVKSLASDQSVLEATYAAKLSPSETKQAKVAKVLQTAEQKMTKNHRVSVDLGGGMVAQASTELINLGVRATARWSPDSWFGQNSDILQGAPHFILGLGLYIAEMASRKNMVLPSTTREVMSEASKLFAQLGFSNVVRALRVRYGDGQQKDLDLEALKNEKAELLRRLQEMQAAKGK